jgi:hypothetical protein
MENFGKGLPWLEILLHLEEYRVIEPAYITKYVIIVLQRHCNSQTVTIPYEALSGEDDCASN